MLTRLPLRWSVVAWPARLAWSRCPRRESAAMAWATGAQAWPAAMPVAPRMVLVQRNQQGSPFRG